MFPNHLWIRIIFILKNPSWTGAILGELFIWMDFGALSLLRSTRQYAGKELCCVFPHILPHSLLQFLTCILCGVLWSKCLIFANIADNDISGFWTTKSGKKLTFLGPLTSLVFKGQRAQPGGKKAGDNYLEMFSKCLMIAQTSQWDDLCKKKKKKRDILTWLTVLNLNLMGFYAHLSKSKCD